MELPTFKAHRSRFWKYIGIAKNKSCAFLRMSLKAWDEAERDGEMI